MKLATFSDRGTDRLGLVDPIVGTVLDLAAAADGLGRSEAPFASMLQLIEAGDRGLDLARDIADHDSRFEHTRSLAETKLRAPIPVPPQIRDFTVFPRHAAQAPVGMRKLAARLSGQPIPDIEAGPVAQVYVDRPIYYITNRFSVIGPDETVIWPSYSSYMDFELEFAAVIGRRGRDIAREEAGSFIFGYTVFNDFSARDAQFHEMAGMLGPAKGKSFDGGNAFGPWIVTADEIADDRCLKMEARVNGEVWASGDSSEMLHSFRDMIAHVSRSETLYPGEIFGSGTMGGGCGLELDRYLSDGDIVELEVEKIGTLRNTVRLADKAV